MVVSDASSLIDMLPAQVFVPDPVGRNVTRDPETESKLLNVTTVEDDVISHDVLPG